MKTLLCFAFSLACCSAIVVGVQHAEADSGSAVMLDAGAPAAGSAAATPSQPTAAQLPDPTQAPVAAFDEIKAAKKLGWPMLAFVLLIFLNKGASKLSSKLAWLNKGKTPVVVAAMGALGASCYDAAVSGGSWLAIAMAGAVALAHYLDASKPAPAPSSP